jgi:predicted O-methyltransferase YrrM
VAQQPSHHPPEHWLRLAHPSLQGPLAESLRIQAAARAQGTPPPALPEPLRPARFRTEVLQAGDFTADWFTSNISMLHGALARSGRAFERLLEIGSFEGLSTCWFARLLAGTRPAITAIDLFADDPDYHAGGAERYEQRFDRNAAKFLGGVALRKIKQDSAGALSALVAENARFDLVYVDGSHAALDVIVDAALGWRLLDAGGVMVFDDYFWVDPRVPQRVLDGANAFLDLVAGQYRVLGAHYQAVIQKT